MATIIQKRFMARAVRAVKLATKFGNSYKVWKADTYKRQKVPLQAKIPSGVKPVISSGHKISTGAKEIIIEPQHKTLLDVHHGDPSKSFKDLLLRSDVVEGLESLGAVRPTIIQLLAIPKVLEKKNIFCAAQTGSGKTIVYAAPIIHTIKELEEEGVLPRLSRPRALVIAPGRELATQILGVFRQLGLAASVRSLGLIGQQKKAGIQKKLADVFDILVGTPNTVINYHKRGKVSFADLQYVVLDEADTLFDESFKQTTSELLNLCSVGEKGRGGESIDALAPRIQFILTAATVPKRGVLSICRNEIHDLELVESNLHRVLPHVRHKFIKTTQKEKSDMLKATLRTQLAKSSLRKVIVFCNKSSTCHWLSEVLSKSQIEHSKLHGNVTPLARFDDFEDFQSGRKRILLCTDLGSRGLDAAEVNLVINFDCPFNTTDYVHRAGRTGRARQTCSGVPEVLTYITQNKEVHFASKIKEAAAKNSPLEDIRRKQSSPKTRYEAEMKHVE